MQLLLLLLPPAPATSSRRGVAEQAPALVSSAAGVEGRPRVLQSAPRCDLPPACFVHNTALHSAALHCTANDAMYGICVPSKT
jgi:hypothetical protein